MREVEKRERRKKAEALEIAKIFANFSGTMLSYQEADSASVASVPRNFKFGMTGTARERPRHNLLVLTFCESPSLFHLPNQTIKDRG